MWAPSALSCATRQGGLLLVGTDGNPDVVHDHESADGSHSGDQASDGLVGHDVTLGVRLGERRQGALILEPSTRPRYRVSGLAPKGQLSKPARWPRRPA